ncbi:MAG: hypothetical protein R3325_02620 [Thermoanaerobaculia bacterium]|nr:hypothetical protein [Thermoanaerobaculia bacterium]
MRPEDHDRRKRPPSSRQLPVEAPQIGVERIRMGAGTEHDQVGALERQRLRRTERLPKPPRFFSGVRSQLAALRRKIFGA